MLMVDSEDLIQFRDPRLLCASSCRQFDGAGRDLQHYLSARDRTRRIASEIENQRQGPQAHSGNE